MRCVASGTGERTAASVRDIGVDLARGLAILAMVVAHVKMWWQVDSRPVALVLTQINNVASPLFCLVMGVAAGLVLTRVGRPVRPAAFVLRNVVRGVALIAIGILLEQLPSHIAIVLQVLGVVLVVGSPLVLLPTPVVLAAAVLSFFAGPMVNEAVAASYVPQLGPLDRVMEWVALSQHYRLTNLLPFFLVGAVLGRRGPRDRDALLVLALGLLGVVVLAGSFATGGDLRSGSLLDNTSDLGLSFTAFGATVLLARRHLVRPVLRLLTPLQAVGALALSTYVLHVVLIAALNRYAGWPTLLSNPLPPSLGVLVATLCLGWLWWRFLGRGPIERLLALATDRIR